ncbi:MAG: hypothetical protein RL141_27 [Candidatus Parcubacteria bacterium]|jgi:hypothetical protein
MGCEIFPYIERQRKQLSPINQACLPCVRRIIKNTPRFRGVFSVTACSTAARDVPFSTLVSCVLSYERRG